MMPVIVGPNLRNDEAFGCGEWMEICGAFRIARRVGGFHALIAVDNSASGISSDHLLGGDGSCLRQGRRLNGPQRKSGKAEDTDRKDSGEFHGREQMLRWDFSQPNPAHRPDSFECRPLPSQVAISQR